MKDSDVINSTVATMKADHSCNDDESDPTTVYGNLHQRQGSVGSNGSLISSSSSEEEEDNKEHSASRSSTGERSKNIVENIIEVASSTPVLAGVSASKASSIQMKLERTLSERCVVQGDDREIMTTKRRAAKRAPGLMGRRTMSERCVIQDDDREVPRLMPPPLQYGKTWSYSEEKATTNPEKVVSSTSTTASSNSSSSSSRRGSDLQKSLSDRKLGKAIKSSGKKVLSAVKNVVKKNKDRMSNSISTGEISETFKSIDFESIAAGDEDTPNNSHCELSLRETTKKNEELVEQQQKKEPRRVVQRINSFGKQTGKVVKKVQTIAKNVAKKTVKHNNNSLAVENNNSNDKNFYNSMAEILPETPLSPAEVSNLTLASALSRLSIVMEGKDEENSAMFGSSNSFRLQQQQQQSSQKQLIQKRKSSQLLGNGKIFDIEQLTPGASTESGSGSGDRSLRLSSLESLPSLRTIGIMEAGAAVSALSMGSCRNFGLGTSTTNLAMGTSTHSIRSRSSLYSHTSYSSSQTAGDITTGSSSSLDHQSVTSLPSLATINTAIDSVATASEHTYSTQRDSLTGAGSVVDDLSASTLGTGIVTDTIGSGSVQHAAAHMAIHHMSSQHHLPISEFQILDDNAAGKNLDALCPAAILLNSREPDKATLRWGNNSANGISNSNLDAASMVARRLSGSRVNSAAASTPTTTAPMWADSAPSYTPRRSSFESFQLEAAAASAQAASNATSLNKNMIIPRRRSSIDKSLLKTLETLEEYHDVPDGEGSPTSRDQSDRIAMTKIQPPSLSSSTKFANKCDAPPMRPSKRASFDDTYEDANDRVSSPTSGNVSSKQQNDSPTTMRRTPSHESVVSINSFLKEYEIPVKGNINHRIEDKQKSSPSKVPKRNVAPPAPIRQEDNDETPIMGRRGRKGPPDSSSMEKLETNNSSYQDSDLNAVICERNSNSKPRMEDRQASADSTSSSDSSMNGVSHDGRMDLKLEMAGRQKSVDSSTYLSTSSSKRDQDSTPNYPPGRVSPAIHVMNEVVNEDGDRDCSAGEAIDSKIDSKPTIVRRIISVDGSEDTTPYYPTRRVSAAIHAMHEVDEEEDEEESGEEGALERKAVGLSAEAAKLLTSPTS